MHGRMRFGFRAATARRRSSNDRATYHRPGARSGQVIALVLVGRSPLADRGGKQRCDYHRLLFRWLPRLHVPRERGRLSARQGHLVRRAPLRRRPRDQGRDDPRAPTTRSTALPAAKSTSRSSSRGRRQRPFDCVLESRPPTAILSGQDPRVQHVARWPGGLQRAGRPHDLEPFPPRHSSTGSFASSAAGLTISRVSTPSCPASR